MGKSDPRARDRIIGAKLRAIRTERADISLERAAEMAGWSPSRLSRTERGLRNVTTDEVATLLTAWRIPAGEREEVLAEVQAGSSSGWWDRPLPGVPAHVGALASYEADAYELVDVSPNAVPGLLHTYETAIAVMRAGSLPEDDLETRWMVRLRRQQILGKVDYTAFIGETALRTPFGGRQALKGQLEHLLGAQDRAMRIRVIPAHQTKVLLLHSWMFMRFPNTKPVVYVELSVGAFYIHDQDVAPYTATLERLDQVALTQDDSRKLMGDLVKRL
ncbi:helix-turn-helix domain-containing protein [Actinophytocola sp. NPDC049390]|uniref:helix-turn-helix domain-containing protein n=1 Tax=Actinophytocola sp. NPDC049390 TaxID=3363894 RepID=UPI00378C08DB